MYTVQKLLLTTSLSLALLALFAVPAYAGGDTSVGNCVATYGGGVSCPAVVGETLDKTIRNPATGAYVDGLGPNHPINTRFQPGDTASFRIMIKNTGDQPINRVIVKDTLPSYVMPVSGVGTYDAAVRTMTFTIDNLAPWQVYQGDIALRVVSASELPANRTLLCGSEAIVNRVEMWADGRQTSDEVPFCIGNPPPVFVSEKTPQAGVEELLVPAFATILGAGIYLSRKAGKS